MTWLGADWCCCWFTARNCCIWTSILFILNGLSTCWWLSWCTVWSKVLAWHLVSYNCVCFCLSLWYTTTNVCLMHMFAAKFQKPSNICFAIFDRYIWHSAVLLLQQYNNDQNKDWILGTNSLALFNTFVSVQLSNITLPTAFINLPSSTLLGLISVSEVSLNSI